MNITTIKILPFFFATGLVFGQTASFPGALPGDADLLVAADSADTTLVGAINSSSLTVNLTSAARFPANSLITIDSEIMKSCSVDGNTVTICAGGRGYAGTSAASHLSGARVTIRVSAWYWNRMREEVKAIASALGVNMSGGGVFYPHLYDWERGGSGTLTGGTQATVTLTPVPIGFNAAVFYDQYVYISGGTGTAEAVAITGGTAVSGAASGTITFTPVNSHSGAWTVRSASSGMREAADAARATTGGTIKLVPRAGGYKLYANYMFVWQYQTLTCEGGIQSLDANYVSSFPATDGCTINIYAGKNTTSGAAIQLLSGSTVENVRFFYPEQTPTSPPIQFPPTLKLAPSASNDVNIRDCYVDNAYMWLDATGAHGRMVLSGILGHPLYMGINIDNALDMDVLENIRLTPFWYPNPGLTFPDAYVDTHINWAANNGIAINLGRLDSGQFHNISVNGYGVGIQFTPGTTGAGSYGSISQYFCESVRFCMIAPAAGGIGARGWSVGDSEMTAGDFFAYQRPGGTITGATNNGSGLIRIAQTAHGYTTNECVTISGVTGTTGANGAHCITVIDVDHYDLVGSTFSGTYTGGGTAVKYTHIASLLYLIGLNGPVRLSNSILSGFSETAATLFYSESSSIYLDNSYITAWGNGFPLFDLAGTATLSVSNTDFWGINSFTGGFVSPYHLLLYASGFTGLPARFANTTMRANPVITSAVSPTPKTTFANNTQPNGLANQTGWTSIYGSADVASADTITPTGPLFNITGTTQINTINLPFPAFEGTFCAIPNDIFTTGTSGNIPRASTAVPGKTLCFTYIAANARWYPSY